MAVRMCESNGRSLLFIVEGQQGGGGLENIPREMGNNGSYYPRSRGSNTVHTTKTV